MDIKFQEFNIEEYIPTGSKNAISRDYLSKKLGMTDRAIRKAIAESDVPIINLGYGYFIPNMNDEYDRHEALVYCQQEINRIRSLQEKVNNKFDALLTEIATTNMNANQEQEFGLEM